MAQQPVLRPIRLMAEGKTDADFLYKLLQDLGLTGTIWAEEFTPDGDKSGGVTKLSDKLAGIIQTNEVQTGKTKVLAVMRDADEGDDRAFQSVSNIIDLEGLPVPQSAGVLSSPGIFDIRTAILIVPSRGEGALEDLILSALADDPVLGCVDDMFENVLQCISDAKSPLSQSKHQKARYQMYLAARGGRLHDDTALNMSWFPWEHPAFDDVKQFLTLLADATQ